MVPRGLPKIRHTFLITSSITLLLLSSYAISTIHLESERMEFEMVWGASLTWHRVKSQSGRLIAQRAWASSAVCPQLLDEPPHTASGFHQMVSFLRMNE